MALSRHTLFHRAEMVLGKDVMSAAAQTPVIIFGIGGVGSWCAEALVRTGCANLTLVDSDTVCATNINRQLQATTENIGKDKVEEMRKRLLEINPAAEITPLRQVFNSSTCAGFNLKSFAYVIDAIDSLKDKVLLLESAYRENITCFSSMGAGAKRDPTRIQIAPLGKTRFCPLARMVRKRLSQRGIPQDFLCVYSDEPPMDAAIASRCGTGECSCPKHDIAESPDWCRQKARINGTLVHITAIFGFYLASMVIHDLVKRHSSSSAAARTAAPF